MGRRRKKRSVKRPHWRERRPPKVFQCPICGAVSVTVKIVEEEDSRYTLIACSNPKCRMRSRIDNVPMLFTPVDIYSMFMDLYNEGKAKIWFEEVEEGGEEESGGASEEEE